MDPNTLNHWRRTIKRILTDLAAVPFPEVVTMSAKTVFDEAADVYLVVVEGWQDVRRLHGCLVHVEIKGDKIWVQQDGTEDGVVADLLAAGISKDCIVLGFKSPASRQYTGFAVA
jgi:XisI protein